MRRNRMRQERHQALLMLLYSDRPEDVAAQLETDAGMRACLLSAPTYHDGACGLGPLLRDLARIVSARIAAEAALASIT